MSEQAKKLRTQRNELIGKLRREGRSLDEIGAQVGISDATVCKVLGSMGLTEKDPMRQGARTSKIFYKKRLARRAYDLLPIGTEVKLSECGLAASGPAYSGLNDKTRGIVVPGNWPDSPTFLAVLIPGNGVGHWHPTVWEPA